MMNVFNLFNWRNDCSPVSRQVAAGKPRPHWLLAAYPFRKKIQRSGNGRRFLALALCVLGCAASAWPAEENVYKVRLNGLEVWLDAENGDIIRLSSDATGVLLEGSRERSGLLDAAYPINSFLPLRLASRFSKAQVRIEDNQVTIRWDTLGPSRSNIPLPPGHVRAQATIRAADDGRSVILSCRIENLSEAAIPQVLFPDLWGMTALHGPERTELRLARGVTLPFTVASREPESAPPYYERTGWQPYLAQRSHHGGYYAQNALRWLDFGGLGGGLSVFQRKWGTQDLPDVFTYRSESDPLHLRLTWQQKGQIEPGQTWESGEFWLTPHPGGWAKGIEVYRDYVRRTSPPRTLPEHVRNGLGFRSIWMTQIPETNPGEAYFKYRDLPSVAEDSIQHGLDELVPWFWSCSYFRMPVHSCAMLGTEQELLQGMDQARALGVNVAPFFSIHIILNPAVSRYGVNPALDDWDYHPEFIPQFQPFYIHALEGTFISDDNPVWQQDVQDTLSEWVNRGMHSLTFDQFHYKQAPGRKPALIRIAEQVRAAARSKDPQSTFSGESMTDLELDSAILDYTWNWTDYLDAGPIVSVLRSPRLNCNVENSPLAVKRCFAEGLYLNVMPSKTDGPNGTALIRERPSLARALKTVASLRKQFLPYFTEGDALGNSVLSETAAAFVRAYRLRDRILVFVLNDQAEAQHVAFDSSLPIWLPGAGRLNVKYFDENGKLVRKSSMETGRWHAATELLQPGEISAFELQPE